MARTALALFSSLAVGCLSNAPAPDVNEASFSGWDTPDVIVKEDAAIALPARPGLADAAAQSVARRLAYERGAGTTLDRRIDHGSLADATVKSAALAPRNRPMNTAITAPELARSSAAADVHLASTRSAPRRTRSLSIATKASGEGLSKNQIREVVSSSMGQVRACYERALKSAPSLAGRVVVDWQVSATGDVTTAGIRTDSIGDLGLQSCIVETVKGWAFPPATAATPVSFPFTLKPG